MHRIAVFMDQRFSVDPDVADLARGLRKRDYSAPMVRLWVLSLVVATGLFITIGVNGTKARDALGRSSSEYWSAAIPMMLSGVAMVFGAICFLLYYQRVSNPRIDEENKVRGKKYRSVKRSIEAGRKLDVPVLTADHVEAGLRLDNWAANTAGSLSGWNRKEVDRLRVMILSDLSREDSIRSIIEERGASSVAEVGETLAEMEVAGKPLQDGWL